MILAKHGDGSCIYWNNGCTIYANRPMTCQAFDCRALLVTDIAFPSAIYNAAKEKFAVVPKEPGDGELLKRIRLTAIQASQKPNMTLGAVIREALNA